MNLLSKWSLKWVTRRARISEFYKDLGWEAEYEYIKPYIMPMVMKTPVLSITKLLVAV